MQRRDEQGQADGAQKQDGPKQEGRGFQQVDKEFHALRHRQPRFDAGIQDSDQNIHREVGHQHRDGDEQGSARCGRIIYISVVFVRHF